mmetsp:Transcript_6430/g.11486  ORF Transcript_6430/g.11486 Transcript_6430/m.11486 type:complete len:1105 (+) Transcript_6430:44-3358(+)|eukprot:CAMPEP_0197659198 /NCGR_PEP_ID=MMETSP1338-20131121/46587_1 /TAXON_ID=43686 ORGANISM="Pelagodinium beii, Strain RCC1491" /NCGR_SAMPLE_ID=MMETSP1338 /ASSEMBLY_ACC=CAM_ASM_000754 /LENGTH=1104 /DNA_ID=CAMNT_0043235999 /DNA_START=40 /DNA_END=3354 /DNA_ORIENTATION=+
MAPKKKDAAPADALEPGPEEEEEEGPGKATICLAVRDAKDLPAELETIVGFTGFCKENRSSPAASSSAPDSWELPKDKIIRLQNQDLYNDLVEKPLVVSLRDAGADNALVGRAQVSLLPLLHDQTEVTAELELTLTPEYHAKWYPEAEPAEDPKKKGGKDKKGAAAPEEPKEVVPKFTGETPPPTKITVSVTVEDLIGPVEDRNCWTTMTLEVPGVFSLPDGLVTLGVASPDDFSAHPIAYRASLMGESMVGTLTKAAEVPEEGSEEAPTDPDGLRAWAERFKISMSFAEKRMVRYRGKAFVEEFRQMLNSAGGVWFYFNAEEKLSSDPKKPNPPEVGEMSRHCAGAAWLDLRELIAPKIHQAASCCALEPSSEVIKEAGESEPLLQSSGTFVRLSLELSLDVTPDEPEELKIHPKKLLPHHDVNTLPDSADSAKMYREAVELGFNAICNDCRGGVRGGVQGAVTQLKEVGRYEELKTGLRNSVVQVFRERLRKDTSAVPGKPLRGKARDDFISSTYSYLQLTVAEVLDELRAAPQAPERPAPVEPVDEGSRPGSRPSIVVAQGPIGSKSSPTDEVQQVPQEEAPVLSVAAILAESIASRKAREVLGVATNESMRCSRLAYEAELVGNWDRAAGLLQNRFLLEELNLREDPHEWIAFAKFCGRSRGRSAAAEEALRQAVRLLADGKNVHEDTALEVDLFLACLLLDRGRHEEAMEVFQSWHEKDFANGTFRFLLGLALFLRCRFEEAQPYLESVGKPREWFQGLPDNNAVINKLKAFRQTDGPLDVAPYAAICDKLLSFGLPSLVFTFLDQTNTLPKASLDSERMVLIDAKASSMDRDFAAACNRLESLLAGGHASKEAWRLAGESYLQIQEFDRALQALQTSLSFEQKFDDPAIYIRLGSVLLVKKRWKQAREAFLRSIQWQATAEAWSGVAYAEYRSEEFQTSYEALCEANVLDNERADVWAQLCLVHLRTENWDAADHACRHCLGLEPQCEDLLLEAASEYHRRERQLTLAEACARRALQVRDSGQGHGVLADVLAQNGQAENSVLEAQIAIKMLSDQPELRKAIFAKALKLCEELDDAPLAESLHAVQKIADEQHEKTDR